MKILEVLFKVEVAVRFVLFGPIPSILDSVRFLLDPFWCVDDGDDWEWTLLKEYVKQNYASPDVFSQSRMAMYMITEIVAYFILMGREEEISDYNNEFGGLVLRHFMLDEDLHKLLNRAVEFGLCDYNDFYPYISDAVDWIAVNRASSLLGSELGRRFLDCYIKCRIPFSVEGYLIDLSLEIGKRLLCDAVDYKIYALKCEDSDVKDKILSVLDMKEEVVLEKWDG